MKQVGNLIVLLILIVAIAVVASPLLPGDGAPAAKAAASAAPPAGVLRVVPSHASPAVVPTNHRVGEWAMLLVGSALIVVGAALRRPDTARPSARRARLEREGHAKVGGAAARGPRQAETSLPGRE